MRIEEFADRASFEAHLDNVYGTDPEWAEVAPFLEGLRIKAVDIARDLLVPLADSGPGSRPGP